MPRWKSYERRVFGRQQIKLEGVDQGYDEAGEPDGRVQFASDADFTTETLKKRAGYDILNRYSYASILSMVNVTFQDDDRSVAIYTGAGDIIVIRNLA